VYPDPPLLPTRDAERARALELEDFFDRRAGEAVRQWIYGSLMAEKAGRAAEALFALYPWKVRAVGKLVAPIIERAIRTRYRINRDTLVSARATVLDVADRLDKEVGGNPSRYLVGDSLSITDITAASLLSPVLMPVGSPYEALQSLMPASMAELQNLIRGRIAGQWIAERYRLDRGQKESLRGGERHE
jgi:glutathione S-transferase